MLIAGRGKAYGQVLTWGTSARMRMTPPGSGAAGFTISARWPHSPPFHCARYAWLNPRGKRTSTNPRDCLFQGDDASPEGHSPWTIIGSGDDPFPDRLFPAGH